jgi:hypothetical protein
MERFRAGDRFWNRFRIDSRRVSTLYSKHQFYTNSGKHRFWHQFLIKIRGQNQQLNWCQNRHWFSTLTSPILKVSFQIRSFLPGSACQTGLLGIHIDIARSAHIHCSYVHNAPGTSPTAPLSTHTVFHAAQSCSQFSCGNPNQSSNLCHILDVNILNSRMSKCWKRASVRMDALQMAVCPPKGTTGATWAHIKVEVNYLDVPGGRLPL